jgi:hypothetical protein
VIGNGTSSGDGQVEVGSRWPKQINGGHVHSDYLNNIAIGICLVGDFNHEQPTAKQLEALDELIRYLRQRVGKTDGKWAVVKAHKEINPPRWPTDSHTGGCTTSLTKHQNRCLRTSRNAWLHAVTVGDLALPLLLQSNL